MPRGQARLLAWAPIALASCTSCASCASSAALGTDAPSDRGRSADEVVGWRTELAEDSPTLLEAFRARAESYGCRTTKLDRAGVVVRCPEAAVAMTKEGLRVTVACAGVRFEACHALFERISASTDTSGE